jgi:hypothetical protein
MVWTLLGILPLMLAFLYCLKIWKDDARFEKYFKDSYKEMAIEGCFIIKKRSIPVIIVGTEKIRSKIRVFLKKTISKLRTREEPLIIYIFGKEEEEEKKAYIIQQAFASEWRLIEILDVDFIESAINYFAYKFVANKKKIDDKTKYLIRKDYENSKYRECVAKLDDIDFSEQIVINPPPQKKPLLRELIMPMLLDQNGQSKSYSFQKKEEIKSLFMKICDSMYAIKCGILFVGDKSAGEYLNLLLSSTTAPKCYLLCAIGANIIKLDYLFERMKEPLLSRRRYNYNALSGTFASTQHAENNYKRLFIECLA